MSEIEKRILNTSDKNKKNRFYTTLRSSDTMDDTEENKAINSCGSQVGCGII